MTFALAIQIGVGVLAFVLGVPLLFAPSRVARALHAGNVEAARYGLRIAGMMLAMFGIILTMFAGVAAFAQVR